MTVSIGPNISVIIPVYNGAEFLTRCLYGVLATHDASYECIVVNDDSTDASAAIAAQFSDRIRLLNLMGGPYGPAYARNRGAEVARGDILFFVDADVVLLPGALERVAESFAGRPDLAAVFGSYDAHPTATGLISRYRNLLHHFVHQNGNPDASTFWAGCGAIRKKVFAKIGGFDEKRFPRASIEDIDLGYRLRASGQSVRLDKDLQGTHLKRWSFWSVIRTDIAYRAIPWSRLILESKKLPNDLNLNRRERASLALVALAFLSLLLTLSHPQFFAGLVTALLAVIGVNRNLYAFFYRQGGALFAAGCILLHLLYYLYSGLAFLWAWTEFHLRRIEVSIFQFQLRQKARSTGK